jgi:hypothetical protein
VCIVFEPFFFFFEQYFSFISFSVRTSPMPDGGSGGRAFQIAAVVITAAGLGQHPVISKIMRQWSQSQQLSYIDTTHHHQPITNSFSTNTIPLHPNPYHSTLVPLPTPTYSDTDMDYSNPSTSHTPTNTLAHLESPNRLQSRFHLYSQHQTSVGVPSSHIRPTSLLHQATYSLLSHVCPLLSHDDPSYISFFHSIVHDIIYSFLHSTPFWVYPTFVVISFLFLLELYKYYRYHTNKSTLQATAQSLVSNSITHQEAARSLNCSEAELETWKQSYLCYINGPANQNV